ncbi:MAG: DNA-directed RNA polymerase subunit omega [Candidatus Omnitrophica bacterium CG08_land_8_20_14_0_20_41_16]|uniref:DNA-directed RNA polymerase subunit omega n=1 Tax=Candidatus Sherwoodlollariibacterium unditelluris TaxID=1974757 RepID=A0A2G9YKH0_9BACT|nr:MAG: DNA-directed RNA polymerase subunit omega [Candidatus Omnitrophica bacterium CG23_combo_of_CG06-09_8_20_14_all_41_10]PIS33432.1 MAG: DNA-directed RNA polymerase subunit omega [Candidatus Omnitrophica bacterium CG08_land_8_20_14_0_20_41_16]
MGYVEREKLLRQSESSIYKLVNLAAKRALEIAEGQPRLVDVSADIKPSTVALYEIAAGRIQAKKIKQKK